MTDAETIYEHYLTRKELQHAMRLFTVNLDPAYFVTANFNVPNMTLKQSRDALCEFDKRMNRRFYNKKFCHQQASDRLFFIAFPEHINSNLHCHLLTRVPQQLKPRFEIYAAYEFKKVIPSASLRVDKLRTSDDIRKASYYACKENFKIENYDNFIISTEFSNSKKKYQINCLLSNAEN